MSCCGVAIPLVDFFWKACSTPLFEQDRRSIVMSAASLSLPPELERRTVKFLLDLPTEEELKKVATAVVEKLKREQQIKVDMTPADFDRLVERMMGLTLFEAEHSLTKAILRDLALTHEDLDFILEIKREVLGRDGLLEYVATEADLGAVGGFMHLKAWLAKRRWALSLEARQFGIDPPKGILLLGVQGCGKTLVAKAVAQDWACRCSSWSAGASMTSSSASRRRTLKRRSGWPRAWRRAC